MILPLLYSAVTVVAPLSLQLNLIVAIAHTNSKLFVKSNEHITMEYYMLYKQLATMLLNTMDEGNV